MQTILTQWQEQIKQAIDTKQSLTIQGSNSKNFYGQPVRSSHILNTRAYHGIVAYDPAELVLTVRCGTPLTEIEAALAEKNQILPFEPPYFGQHTTIGGCVAAGLAGPRRAFAGAIKDFVLGAKLMDGKGQWLTFGGQVMKNVAGYDVSRLLAGSLGTLGIIGEISFKVLPKSIAEQSICFEMDEATATAQMNEWMGQPLPLSASFWHEGILTVRLNGAKAGIDAALKKLGGQIIETDTARTFWHSIREQQHPAFRLPEGQRLWRISLPDTCPPLDFDATPVAVEWGGAQRWYVGDWPAKTLRDIAAQHGGHATLFRGTIGENETVFHPCQPAVLAIQQRLKQAFDPHQIFNIGRLYPEI